MKTKSPQNLTDKAALKGTITLVLGGVRSGKSRFAQDLAAQLGGDDVLFVATAESRDDEMDQRIQHHRKSRPATWQTLEQPLRTGRTIAAANPLPAVVLVDCLTLLVSNVMCRNESEDIDDFKQNFADLETCVLHEVDALIEVAAKHSTHLLIVSGEVGSGVVPEHKMGRMFRDLLGFANQRIAASATVTYWMLAGLAINATDIAINVERAASGLCQNNKAGIEQ